MQLEILIRIFEEIIINQKVLEESFEIQEIVNVLIKADFQCLRYHHLNFSHVETCKIFLCPL